MSASNIILALHCSERIHAPAFSVPARNKPIILLRGEKFFSNNIGLCVRMIHYLVVQYLLFVHCVAAIITEPEPAQVTSKRLTCCPTTNSGVMTPSLSLRIVDFVEIERVLQYTIVLSVLFSSVFCYEELIRVTVSLLTIWLIEPSNVFNKFHIGCLAVRGE